MSRTMPRSTISFKSGRRIVIEAPDSNKTRPRTEGQDGVSEAGWMPESGALVSEKTAPVTVRSGARNIMGSRTVEIVRGEDGGAVNTNTNSMNNSDNSNNNNTRLLDSSNRHIMGSIQVVNSSRRGDSGARWKKENAGVYSTSNNITCSRDPSSNGSANATATQGSEEDGRDSSSNNTASHNNINNGACIVDNLVMEAGKTEKTTNVECNNNKQVAPAIGLQSSGAASDASQIAPEVAFSDPRQSQVFQTLTGVQRLRGDMTFADITVKVKDTEFRCHRFVLATGSTYLQDLIRDAAAATDDSDTAKPSESVNYVTQNDVELDGSAEKQASRLKDADNEEGQETEGDDDGDKSRGGHGPAERDSPTGKGSNSENGNEIPLAKKPVAAPSIDKTSNDGFIVLPGIRPDIFSKMLDFMYCQFEGVITEDSCLELLLAADTIQLPHLRRACAAYITDTLSAKNVFQVMSLCDSGHAHLFEPRIMKKAHQVIRENFSRLVTAEEFLNLGRHVMIPLVADSMLHTRSEMDVLQALLRWVRARPEERCSDMTLMLQHVRFPLMSARELDKLREVPILHQNSLAMALIEESRAYGNLDYNERMAWPRHNSISRCLFSTRDLILWTADRDKGLHFYSIIDGQHHKVTSFGELTSPQHNSTNPNSCGGAAAGNFSFDSTSSVCCYGDKVFFTGGEFNTDMVWSVDTSSGEVKVHSKMPRGRKFHSMVASKGCVYCLGGQDKRGYSVLEDVDAYIINKDMWVKVGHLAVPAYNMSAVVSGGAVYLVGGFDHAGQPLRLIQCFIALRSGLYSAFKVEINNMPPSLLSARAVACGLDNSIYIVCGHGEVYQFEPDSQSLSHVTSLRNLSENPRVRFGLAYVGGCLVVIGGHQLGHVMHEPIRSVCLDIASKTEVRDYSPLLPGDIVNTCLAAKLSSNILHLFTE